MDHQNITVTTVQQNRGCFSGCGTFLAVALLIGLAVEYWYVSVALAAAGVAFGVYWYLVREPPLQASAPALATAGTAPCPACGQTNVVGAFCHQCGAAQSKTCTGCGRTGLESAYCPDCGAATYAPPQP